MKRVFSDWTIGERLAVAAFVLTWTGFVLRVLWQWKVGPLERTVKVMEVGEEGDKNRRVARLADMNGVGERLAVVERQQERERERVIALERRMDRSEQVAEGIQRELGAQSAHLAKISDNVAESSAAIIAHIENARREAAASDGMIRERLAAVELAVELRKGNTGRGQ